MGEPVSRQDRLFYEFDLEDMVPGDYHSAPDRCCFGLELAARRDEGPLQPPGLPWFLADRLCIGSFIARIPFATACKNFQNMAGPQTVMGSHGKVRGNRSFFCKVQGETRAP